jgi:hypothetical protein
MPHDGAVQDDVFTAGELAVETETELEERRDAPAHDDASLRGPAHARDDAEETPTRSPGAIERVASRSATSSPCSMRPWSLRIAYSLTVCTASFGMR